MSNEIIVINNFIFSNFTQEEDWDFVRMEIARLDRRDIYRNGDNDVQGILNILELMGKWENIEAVISSFFGEERNLVLNNQNLYEFREVPIVGYIPHTEYAVIDVRYSKHNIQVLTHMDKATKLDVSELKKSLKAIKRWEALNIAISYLKET
jgi:hypothetical protein